MPSSAPLLRTFCLAFLRRIADYSRNAKETHSKSAPNTMGELVDNVGTMDFSVLSLAATNLVSPPVLAFVLGLLAVSLKSDLRLPEAFYQAISIYLLLGIGIKGGVALRSASLAENLVTPPCHVGPRAIDSPGRFLLLWPDYETR